jgi:hypothetical protein
MTFEECKEKYPIGSYHILTHKNHMEPFWISIQNYTVCVRKPNSEVYPSFILEGNTYYFHPDEYNTIMSFPSFKEAEPYISRI